MARILSTEPYFNPLSPQATGKWITEVLAKAPDGPEGIDLVLLGMNGDNRMDESYRYLAAQCFKQVPCACFKNLCGEYDTVSSFALFLAAVMLKKQRVPAAIRLDERPLRMIRKILIYNHVRNRNHSLILLSAC